MSRRTRKRRDVFPQILSITTNDLPDVDDYVVQQFSLPVSRVGTSSRMATVVEILWVDFYMGLKDGTDTSTVKAAFLTTGTLRSSGESCTPTTLAEDVSHPVTMAFALQRNILSTNGGFVVKKPIRVDLSDGAGNGTLVATNQMDLIYGDVSGTSVSGCTAKICYRIVDVGLEEFIGIVQSQSNVVL